MSVSRKTRNKEMYLWMLLIIAACFAIGSVSFFLSVILRQSTSTTASSTQQIVETQAQKDAVMQSLTLSEASSTSLSTARKLQILAQLNAH